MQGKCINQIRLNADQTGNQANAEEKRAQHGDSPLNMILGSPAIDEEANGHKDTEEDERRQTVFWLRHAIVGGSEAFEDAIGSGASQYKANKHADAAGDVTQSNVGT